MPTQTQQRRFLTTPLSRRRKGPAISVGTTILGAMGIFGIVCLLYLVAVRNELSGKSGTAAPMIRKAEVDSVITEEPEPLDDEIGADAGDDRSRDSNEGGTLVLSTKLGPIHITLRPDLSMESTMYLKELAQSGSCTRCNLYRAEKPGILQGVIANPHAEIKVVKGTCPPEYKEVEQPDCPEWDPQCGCHGPTMKRGMVGWAGGGTGPDFFVDTYAKPATWWGQQHTVFGEITDEESLALIDKIYTLPVTGRGGMTYLDEKIQFEMEVLSEE